MYKIKPSNKYKKDLKLLQKRGYNLDLLDTVIDLLIEGKPLPQKYHDHDLHGNFEGCRECHILPDWLLIYEKFEETLYLYLTRTGTHSDLLKQHKCKQKPPPFPARVLSYARYILLQRSLLLNQKENTTWLHRVSLSASLSALDFRSQQVTPATMFLAKAQLTPTAQPLQPFSLS